MKFKIPKNYEPPAGVEEGEEFQDIATFKFEDGNLSLLAIGEDSVSVSSGKPKTAKESIKEKLNDAN